ncbi:hypothetical protein M9458_027065, partial [Cirrhinus mrigala]
ELFAKSIYSGEQQWFSSTRQQLWLYPDVTEWSDRARRPANHSALNPAPSDQSTS